MMTEIMIHSSVGESFSYSNSEFEQAKSLKESKTLIGEEIEDESTLSFNDKLDIAGERSSESTICGSNSEDSVVSNLHFPGKAADIVDDAQESASSTIKSDTSCDDYEYLTTETTVINTTYNMISHPDNQNLGKLSGSQAKEKTDDKSRVIVQILKSNLEDSTKSVSVNETKAPVENQSTHSFRDDVFKMLSKPQSTFDFGNDSSKVFNSIHTSVKSVKTVTQIGSSTKIVQTRRKHGVASFYLYPKGPRLCDIKEVSSSLKSASIKSLRNLHYILYDKYGLCGSDLQISKTIRRISQFCGYPFDKNSSLFKKRENSLLKIPVEMLRGIYEAVFGKSSTLDRSCMVNNLMTLFSNTELYSEIVNKVRQNEGVKQTEPNSSVKLMLSNSKLLSNSDYDFLKKKAKSGPAPFVLLERLKHEDLSSEFRKKRLKVKREAEKETQKEIKMEIEKETPKKERNVVGDKIGQSYALPAYILKGPGKKLKYFPAIVRNVKNAKEKDLNMLHYLLYGRMEPIKVCRRNVLEFSGFLECQSQFISKVQDILKRMNQADLLGVCKILCLRAKTNSKSLRIAKIMEYLKSPFNPFKMKSWRNFMGTENVVAFKNSQSKEPVSKYKAPLYPAEEWSEPEDAVSNDGGFRLRDFRKICSNIECSAPSDLTELNDLLFMKPSDETEIHDKILNFTRFGFQNTSVHYYYRKTLLFYMGPCLVRKIARLLDIENWNSISSHEDLSVCILNFLMKKNNPEASSAHSPLSPTISQFLSSSENADDNPGLSGNSSSFEVSKQSVDQSATNHQESMLISTMSKSSVNSVMCTPNDSLHFDTSQETRNNSSISSANCNEDDAILLRDIIHHPTDQELMRDIADIISEGLFSSLTLGGVVKKIYQLYPLFNLKYRENFIKTETRKMLSEMRHNAVQHIEQNFIRS